MKKELPHEGAFFCVTAVATDKKGRNSTIAVAVLSDGDKHECEKIEDFENLQPLVLTFGSTTEGLLGSTSRPPENSSTPALITPRGSVNSEESSSKPTLIQTVTAKNLTSSSFSSSPTTTQTISNSPTRSYSSSVSNSQGHSSNTNPTSTSVTAFSNLSSNNTNETLATSILIPDAEGGSSLTEQASASHMTEEPDNSSKSSTPNVSSSPDMLSTMDLGGK